MEEVESQLRKIPNLVHYLRIAKTGSTSLLAMFETAKKRAPEACARLGTHFHNVLPRHLRERQPAAMFAVLREPCERFASSFDYVRRRRAFNKHPDEPVHTFEDGVVGAIRWAKLLLHNQSYRLLWDQHTADGAALDVADYQKADERDVLGQKIEPGAREACCRGHTGSRKGGQPMWSVIGWRQAAYVEADTRLGCLPTMREDVQAIFDEVLPGCTLPTEVPHVNDYRADVPTVPNEELCALVKRLRRRDYELWDERCAAAGGRRVRQEGELVWA